MDLTQAILFAKLVNEAYAIPPDNLTNSAGKQVIAAYAGFSRSYTIITSIYACDLATDLNPNRSAARVSIGLVMQSDGGDVAIAIRGTEGILEWIHDAAFLLVKCPFLVGSGLTEDGFTSMYQSMNVTLDPGAPRLVQALSGLSFPKPVTSVTICGHSLGGALATLLALDVAANTTFKNPTAYTYASPRTGDPLFAATYNNAVPNTFRIANRVDIVPKLPLPPLYEHVTGLFELNPVQLLPPKLLVKPEIACQHILSTYLYLLSLSAGGGTIALDGKCAP